MLVALLLILLFPVSVLAAPGVAVVQSAAPTSNGGTQDFTSSGFGTPVCALFFASYGLTNGTVANHAMYAVGFSDFTNEQAIAHADEDNTGGNTDTGANTSANALITLASADQSIDGTAVASTITNGARLTWADAPPAAYLITAVLFNSSSVSNCTVGSLTPSTTIGGTASVSGLGWQPDVIFGFSRNNATTIARTSIGIAVNNGGITQYAIGQNSQNNAATSDITQVMRNDRLVLNPVGTGLSSMDVTSFDSGGFTVTTRDSTSANAIGYLAFKLATGVSAKLIACNSPTSTGAKSCTGAGWTPQAGVFLQTTTTTLGAYTTGSGSNEAYGLSAFTAAQSSVSSIWSNDGVAGAPDTTSITDSKVVRMRRDGADFLTATLTGFQADGVDLNYTVTDGTARLGALLLIQAVSSARSKGGEIVFQ